MSTCGWTVNPACCPDWDSYTPEIRAVATNLATALLDRLTGYQFGQCPVTVRPCGPACQGFTGYRTWPVGGPRGSGAGMPWMIPYVDNGVWRNCGCSGGCSCQASQEIHMGVPVAEVTEVVIDGLVLDPSAYSLESQDGKGPLLVRRDGGVWPQCQDMDAEPGEDGSFTVTYVPGRALPVDGPVIAGMLACQFAKSCAGGGGCALPQELQSLTRNGVDLQVIDETALPDAILTGVAEVDRWVRSLNPANLRARPRVLSPDVRRHRVIL